MILLAGLQRHAVASTAGEPHGRHQPTIACRALWCCRSHEDGRARYNQDKEQQSRLVAYICVTALLAEPGACLPPASCSALAATLKLPLPDLVTRFRWAGARAQPAA